MQFFKKISAIQFRFNSISIQKDFMQMRALNFCFFKVLTKFLFAVSFVPKQYICFNNGLGVKKHLDRIKIYFKITFKIQQTVCNKCYYKTWFFFGAPLSKVEYQLILKDKNESEKIELSLFCVAAYHRSIFKLI